MHDDDEMTPFDALDLAIEVHAASDELAAISRQIGETDELLSATARLRRVRLDLGAMEVQAGSLARSEQGVSVRRLANGLDISERNAIKRYRKKQ